MIRKGIPPPLRCAVWISNIIQACHPHQPLSYAHEYRTLAKVRVLDAGYESLYKNTLREGDVKPILFGNTSITVAAVKEFAGGDSLWRVLFALHSVLGVVEYAPLVPTVASILLGHMSESYVFCSIREMAHCNSWYWATSKPEHVAYQRAFLDVLSKLHPSTARTMNAEQMSDRYAAGIFTDFFRNMLPETSVVRIMDIYTLEGTKVLFRIGVALAVLFHRQWKDTYMAGGDWWKSLQDFGTNVSVDLLIKKAYGVHGKGVRKRYRFPRRPILQRIIQLEEERYWNERTGGAVETPPTNPVGLVVPKNGDNDDDKVPMPVLAKSTLVRTKLAEWLPLSLRFTKLDLIFSTNYHGRTLENFYRETKKTKHTIMLVEPLNVENTVVGCYASQTWHPSTKVYGDGACFLFRITTEGGEGEGESKCWKWHYPKSNLLEEEEDDASIRTANSTAILEQYQVGTREYISMGGNSQGGAGLRLNEDLTKGESSKATGFDNLPLAYEEMFEVGQVEVYQLVREMDGIPIH
eukprot:scaffold5466_cov90-Cylindrotheca_fusiformis.AAC.3